MERGEPVSGIPMVGANVGQGWGQELLLSPLCSGHQIVNCGTKHKQS